MSKNKTKRVGKMMANDKEHAVLRHLKKKGAKGDTLEGIARTLFLKKAKKYEKAHSWARNSVRWPFARKFISHSDRGHYTITAAGKKYKHGKVA